jgi:transcriptional regulator with PAS, ATPase and Fis domain
MQAETKLSHYLANKGGFSVLVLGPRGIGKTSTISRLVNPTSSDKSGSKIDAARTEAGLPKRPFIEFNCAAIEDHLAESALFGYEPDAFTGAAKKGRDGLFQAANGGVLVFDEVHTLSKRIQQKLMTALQTESAPDRKGMFPIVKLGGTKREYVRVQPVFASNVSLVELRDALLPDFYDRISQLVVEFPPMPKGIQHRLEAFERIWGEFEFQYPSLQSNSKGDLIPCPCSKQFAEWLKVLPLEGNYRDLDTIAILWGQAYHIYGLTRNSEKQIRSEALRFKFVKEHFEEWHAPKIHARSTPTKYNFSTGKTYWEMLDEYRYELVNWARKTYGSDSAAETALDISRIGAKIPRKYRSK